MPSCASLCCDVLVVGAGAAGIGAATAAARAGARVALLERSGLLGGMASTAGVGTVCGLYLRDTRPHTPVPVTGGFVQEFASRLQQASGTEPLRLEQGLWVLPYAIPAFDGVASKFLGDLKNLKILLHSTATEVLREDERIVQVKALAWNTPVIIEAATLVDATGEATIPFLAGVPTQSATLEQAPALVFALDNLPACFSSGGLLPLRRELRQGIDQGALAEDCARISLVPGPTPDRQLRLKLNLVPRKLEEPEWEQIAFWERQARALVNQLHRFLLAQVPGCENVRLSWVAPQLGVRSGRRVMGRATLRDGDVLSARERVDGVARGCWPMETWGAGPGPQMKYFPEREHYDIPLDCLRVSGLENVLAAGRGFSAEAGAMSSARVIGTALATGWAAGWAAAFQAQGRHDNDAIAELRRRMV